MLPLYIKTSIQSNFMIIIIVVVTITGVEEEIDPMFDPVLEKQLITKGKRKFVNVSDKLMDYDEKFMMYFITRLPNPSFSPELQAKTNVVDFTVTQKGLEEQLLGKLLYFSIYRIQF